MSSVKSSGAVSIDIPVVVLAGGTGSRLRPVVDQVPKILAPIGDQQFLNILLGWLKHQGAQRIIFSLGYMADQVITALSESSLANQLHIDTVTESESLGTLGGVSFVLRELGVEECLVINGDTFVECDLHSFVTEQRENDTFAAILAKHVTDISRFGTVSFKNGSRNDDRLASFVEKQPTNHSPGWINAGVYYFSAAAAVELKVFTKGSMEVDFLTPNVHRLNYSKLESGLFIDIGTPESYQLAPTVLQGLNS